MPEPARHYYKELRLQQFRGLVALARWRTFNAAAKALGITRASVWQQVRSLEQELECSLLLTRGNRIEFTAAGHKLVEIVSPLVAGFDSVKAVLHAFISGDLPQTLVIAAAPSFLVHELRDPISRIHAENPALQLTFLERNSPAAVELLEQGRADLAIAARPDHVPAKPSLEYTQLTTYPFTLICPAGHPLLGKKRLSLRDLTGCPLIMSTGATYCRQHFDGVMEQAGLINKANIVLESNFPIMVFEYVRLGLGVAITPLPQSPSSPWDHSGIVLRSVAHLFGDEPIYHVRRKGQFETPHAARFRELVTEGR